MQSPLQQAHGAITQAFPAGGASNTVPRMLGKERGRGLNAVFRGPAEYQKIVFENSEIMKRVIADNHLAVE